MKKIFYMMMSLCMMLTLLVPSIPAFAKENTDTVSIKGKSAIVLDLETGKHLYEKQIDKRRQPASITKIMTALVVLDKKQLSDNIKFSEKALASIEAGSSSAGLKPGEILTVEQSLYVMMLESANDVAHGLAYATAGDMKTFAEWMNEKARQLGCTGTHFENASGLTDPDHYTTASDMAKIANAAYENETLKNIMSTELYELVPTNKCNRRRTWINGNRMIRKGSKYYYSPCIGGKTGYTINAGGTLVTFARIEDRDLACVVLASTNSVGTYKDSTALYEYVKKTENLSQYNETMVKDKTEESKRTTVQTTAASTKEQGQIIHKEKTSLLSDIPISLRVIVGILIVLLFLCMYLRFKIRRERARMRRKKKLNQQRRQQAQRNAARSASASNRGRNASKGQTTSIRRTTPASRTQANRSQNNRSQNTSRNQSISRSRNTSANRSRMQDRNQDFARTQRRNSSNHYRNR